MIHRGRSIVQDSESYANVALHYLRYLNRKQNEHTRGENRSINEPDDALAISPHLALKLEHTVQQCLGSWWAAGDIDINWDNACEAKCQMSLANCSKLV